MKTRKLHLKAELAWLVYLQNEDDTPNEEIREELHDMIEDLEAFRPTLSIDGEETTFLLRVEPEHNRVCIETDVTDSPPEPDAAEQEMKQAEMRKEWRLDLFEGRLKDLCFIINLAYPGEFHIRDYRIFANGTPTAHRGHIPCDLLDTAVYDAEEQEWPTIGELPLGQCWEWIRTRTHFLSGMSRTPVDRALNALSYSCTSADESSCVFYTLLGLEAIYNDPKSSDSITRQLHNKPRQLLGDYPAGRERELKKQLDAVYRMRSLFTHGITDFPKQWTSEVDPETDQLEEHYYLKTLHPLMPATAILIATLQRFILLDIGHLPDFPSSKANTEKGRSLLQ